MLVSLRNKKQNKSRNLDLKLCSLLETLATIASGLVHLI